MKQTKIIIVCMMVLFIFPILSLSIDDDLVTKDIFVGKKYGSYIYIELPIAAFYQQSIVNTDSDPEYIDAFDKAIINNNLSKTEETYLGPCYEKLDDDYISKFMPIKKSQNYIIVGKKEIYDALVVGYVISISYGYHDRHLLAKLKIENSVESINKPFSNYIVREDIDWEFVWTNIKLKKNNIKNIERKNSLTISYPINIQKYINNWKKSNPNVKDIETKLFNIRVFKKNYFLLSIIDKNEFYMEVQSSKLKSVLLTSDAQEILKFGHDNDWGNYIPYYVCDVDIDGNDEIIAERNAYEYWTECIIFINKNFTDYFLLRTSDEGL